MKDDKDRMVYESNEMGLYKRFESNGPALLNSCYCAQAN